MRVRDHGWTLGEIERESLLAGWLRLRTLWGQKEEEMMTLPTYTPKNKYR